jgi:glycine/D-amino acid oxidase-like deaminating enzyme
MYDAIVLGAGLYGVKTALALRALRLKVALLDPNPMMSGATEVNQQRIHAGFHYPRSIATAETAARHYTRFLIDHAEAVDGNTRHLYCIASDSKVGPGAYEKVLDGIGADYRRVYTPEYFAPGMVAQTYETHERSFNICKLRDMLQLQLEVGGVDRVRAHGTIQRVWGDQVWVRADNHCYRARYVFNCTYSNIDTIVPIRTKLVKEHVEVALLHGPNCLNKDDITIMDGGYWSLMKYPASPHLSALTHVKHGRHQIWSPPEPEPTWQASSKSSEMLQDAARFVPAMAQAKYWRSMYTTRVLLAENHDDDGRPVLIEHAEQSPRVISILGSKFNSVYEVQEFIEKWVQHAF